MEEEKFTDGFKGEGEMLERGGGAHLSSHPHIPLLPEPEPLLLSVTTSRCLASTISSLLDFDIMSCSEIPVTSHTSRRTLANISDFIIS